MVIDTKNVTVGTIAAVTNFYRLVAVRGNVCTHAKTERYGICDVFNTSQKNAPHARVYVLEEYLGSDDHYAAKSSPVSLLRMRGKVIVADPPVNHERDEEGDDRRRKLKRRLVFVKQVF